MIPENTPPGTEIVCIKQARPFPGFTMPNKGALYTVREIRKAYGWIGNDRTLWKAEGHYCVLLHEISNPEVTGREPGFPLLAFRLLDLGVPPSRSWRPRSSVGRESLRMSARMPIADIKALLISRLDGLVRQLVPGAIVKGNVYSAKCPWRQDRQAGSFVIWRAGKAAGGFNEYATGEKGDVLDLVAFCTQGSNGQPTKEERLQAVRWAEAWLGISQSDPRELERAREKARRAQQEAEERAAEAARRRRRRAFDLWLSGKDWRDTPAEAYLRSRGIDPRAIENWDDGVRFAPRLEHWTERGFAGPALIAAMRHPEKGFAALHAVWLRPDGSGKAAIHPPKMTLGAMQGAAMRLTKGVGEVVGGLPPLSLNEGPEDGLTVAQALPEFSVWAVAGLNNFGRQIIPPGTPYCVVSRDNDWDKPQATEAFEKALASLAAQGVPVTEAAAFAGKDMNDLARFGTR